MDNVTLNIYDLMPETRSQQQSSQSSSSSSSQQQRSSLSGFFSGLLSPLGFGAYHTSIDVRGFRYQFGANVGITRTSATLGGVGDSRYVPPNGAYRESIIIGQTWCEQSEINAIIQRMREDKFSGDNYHLANRNCNHFTETFAIALILGNDLLEEEEGNNSNNKMKQHPLDKYPSWVNRLARTGTSLGIDDGKVCNVAAEARIAAGLKGKVGWGLSSSSTNKKSESPKKKNSNSRSQKKELTEKQKAVLAKLKKGSK
mmetsp:Transcript_16302/g.34466  ORF Transcript_16302/g.34466 Transcript_16302/m.34466 type:complete len:257 (-) Transcript_16302:151-921(-)